MDKNKFEILCKKLDKIMMLIATQNVEDKNGKIAILKKAGLSSEEVGELVGVKNPRQMEGWKRKWQILNH